MSDIPELDALLSKRVRVYLNHGGGVLAEGEMVGYYDHPSLCIRQDDGGQVTVSSALRREVVDPLPPEPPVGATVRIKGHGPAHIWTRYPMSANEGEWFAPGETGSYTWEQICAKGEPVRLYRVDEQPQEKYERASFDGYEQWMHLCGHKAGWRPGRSPNEGPSRCALCGNPAAAWTPLYVKADSDG